MVPFGAVHLLVVGHAEWAGMIIVDNRGRVRGEVLGGIETDLPVQQLRLAARLKLAVRMQDARYGRRLLWAKALRSVVLLPLRKPLGRPAVRVPGIVEEELQRELVAFHISDIGYPKPGDAMADSLVQLLPRIGDQAAVHPLVVPAAADIVEVVIQPVAAAAWRQVLVGQ